MQIRLIDIEDVVEGRHYLARALEINGKSPALAGLHEWKKSAPVELKRILAALRKLSDMTRHDGVRQKFVSPDRMGRGIYEICNRGGGSARLFFFYSSRDNRIIVCTNTHSKATRGQREAFALAAEFKALYEASQEQTD